MNKAKSKAKSKANGKDKSSKPIFTLEEEKLLRPVLEQAPPIVELSIGAINIDLSYQDRPRERIVSQVASHFFKGALGILKVAQRPDGSYWAVDGASRFLGLQQRSEKEHTLRCEIFQTQGPKQEALLFAFFNSKRSHERTELITNLQAYSVAGTDHGFGEAIEGCGFSLARGRRQLHGPSYVKKAWDLDDDGAAMKKALYTIKEAWRDNHRIDGYMVLGIALLYHAMRPKAIDEQVRRLLKRTSPSEIMDKVAAQYTTAGGRARIHPDEKPKLVAGTIGRMINKNPGNAGKLELSKLTRLEDRP